MEHNLSCYNRTLGIILQVQVIIKDIRDFCIFYYLNHG
ncbi:hypothetical protein RINTHM_590 [Richelia intracellularis HM01]|nr:hypothetical protein RINTHM_590 [Richelia intracellularis HM01]